MAMFISTTTMQRATDGVYSVGSTAVFPYTVVFEKRVQRACIFCCVVTFPIIAVPGVSLLFLR